MAWGPAGHDPTDHHPTHLCAMRLAFLGPVGTYGEQAAQRLAGLEGAGDRGLRAPAGHPRRDPGPGRRGLRAGGGAGGELRGGWRHQHARCALGASGPGGGEGPGPAHPPRPDGQRPAGRASAKCSPTPRPWRSAASGWRSICAGPCNCPPAPPPKPPGWCGAAASVPPSPRGRRPPSTTWRCWPTRSTTCRATAPASCCSGAVSAPIRALTPAWPSRCAPTVPAPCWSRWAVSPVRA